MYRPMPPPELDYLVMEVDDLADCSDDDRRDLQLVHNFMERCGIVGIRQINNGLGLRYVGGIERGVEW